MTDVPRGGRPTIEETRGDPLLAEKARALRDAGLSWSQVAERLGVGRTTARRLCLYSRNRSGTDSAGGDDLSAPNPGRRFRNGSEIVPIPEHSNHDGGAGSGLEGSDAPGSKDGTELPQETPAGEAEGLPQTFQLFARLLRKASAQK